MKVESEVPLGHSMTMAERAERCRSLGEGVTSAATFYNIMYLVFDSETTGLPKNWKAPMTDIENWPRVIQLAWALYDRDYTLVEKRVDLIKPDGWVIPKEKFWIENGFDQATSEANGIPVSDSLTTFRDALEQTQYLVAHNMSYDYNVVGAEFIRIGLRSKNKPQRICTKDEATDFCQIPGQYGSYKWPTLDELHQKLFDKNVENAHDALADVEACASCFFELVRNSTIKL